MRFAFDNSYARLPERFFARLPPAPVRAPQILRVNPAVAAFLGVDAGYLMSDEGAAILAGNIVPAGAEPLAMAYAGHQFGNWAPQLGDGRAILLGEVTGPDGRRWDIHLKGAGPTPFSRRGDGRAAIGPVLREYILSEAMARLGIPTTRSLAAVATGETVMRETAHPGAVLARVAASHVRVGTFEYFAGQGDAEGARILADHVIARLYPDVAGARDPYRALLEAVVARTASLVAMWQGAGFIHGVMNTDNMSVAGETIDYGPCAFMDAYDPATVFSSIDTMGRYAYGNQPRIAHWNMARLAAAMLPLLGEGEAGFRNAQDAIDAFPALFEAAWTDVFRRKLGLMTAREGDDVLARDLLDGMAAAGVDFTNTFRDLCDAAQGGAMPPGVRADWAARWRARLAADGGDAGARVAAMRRANPAYIPRNHRVEAALAAAEKDGDLGPLDALMDVLASPFESRSCHARYAEPPAPHEVVRATFCGT